MTVLARYHSVHQVPRTRTCSHGTQRVVGYLTMIWNSMFLPFFIVSPWSHRGEACILFYQQNMSFHFVGHVSISQRREVKWLLKTTIDPANTLGLRPSFLKASHIKSLLFNATLSLTQPYTMCFGNVISVILICQPCSLGREYRGMFRENRPTHMKALHTKTLPTKNTPSKTLQTMFVHSEPWLGLLGHPSS